MIKGRGYGTTTSRPPTLNLEEPRAQSRSTYISTLNDGSSHTHTPRSHTPSRSHTPLTPLTPIDPERFLSEAPLPPLETVRKVGKGTVPLNSIESENNRKSQGSSGSGSSGLPSWAYNYYYYNNSGFDNLIQQTPSQEPIEDPDKINPQPSSSAAADSELPNGEESEKTPENRRKVEFKPYRITPRPMKAYRPEVVVLCPRGSILFMFGFLFPPLWWIGSFFPRYVRTNVDYRWKKYNQLMSFVSLFLVAGILSIVIWYLRFYDSSKDTYTESSDSSGS